MQVLNEENVPVTDTGTGSYTPPQSTTDIDGWEFDDTAIEESDLELRVPLKLNELLYDVSDHYSASFQDFADAMMQVKTIGEDIQENECWASPVVIEAVQSALSKTILDAFQECQADEKMMDYINKSTEKMYNDYMEYVDYALEIEAVVALVENEMAKNMPENEFNAIMEAIKNDDKMNSLHYFFSNSTVGYYALGFLGRVGAKYGKSLANPGVAAIMDAIRNHNFAAAMLSLNTHIGVLRDGFYAFLRGDKFDPGVLGLKSKDPTSKIGKITKGAMGSKLMGGAIAAAMVFGINFVEDAFKGEITLENELINLARAGVAGVSSIAGAAVTEAIAAGASGSTVGGLVGAGVSIAISIIGNLVIDKIVHNIKYASNGVPRKYTEMNVETIKHDLEKKGYVLGPPKVDGFDNESVYDVFNTLIPNSGNEKLVYYFIQRNGGLNFMSEEEYKKYDVIIRLWQTFPEIADPRGKEQLIKNVKEWGLEKGSQEELDFVDALYNIFTLENFEKDERIFDFYWALHVPDR